MEFTFCDGRNSQGQKDVDFILHKESTLGVIGVKKKKKEIAAHWIIILERGERVYHGFICTIQTDTEYLSGTINFEMQEQ